MGVLVVAGALGWSATANAGSVSVQFKLPAEDGFRIAFIGDSYGKRVDAGFSVTERRSRTGFSSSTYVRLDGPVISTRRVEADLGQFGAVAMTFDEGSRRKIHSNFCNGYRLVKRGTFTGAFTFTGEHGYTESGGDRAEGTIVVDKIRSCDATPGGGHGGGEVPGKDEPVTALAACARDLSYFAFSDPSGNTNHSASTFERRGDIAVFRGATTFEGPETFQASRDLRRATVSPSLPFTGTGRYHDHHLAGNLKAELLGVSEPVALTPANANLKRSRGGSIGVSCAVGAALAALDPIARAGGQRGAGYRHVAERFIDRLQRVG